jgi:hypothetical protein
MEHYAYADMEILPRAVTIHAQWRQVGAGGNRGGGGCYNAAVKRQVKGITLVRAKRLAVSMTDAVADAVAVSGTHVATITAEMGVADRKAAAEQ